ncbi:U6 snRNA-associated Sm-like protein LSm5 [Nakaseomyces bracarensis]|uniref:U6 snRNA-associated Sm-like protein LSm5 n=1 Tax=Nakaseomyces bracarensis TaxID=273131 RepID=A0ABR4NZZ4_9SACH
MSLDVLPLEVIDRTVDKQVHIILQSHREFKGKLLGFDEFVNVILEDPVEYTTEVVGGNELKSEVVMEHHGRMLLSGNNITMLVPLQQ